MHVNVPARVRRGARHRVTVRAKVLPPRRHLATMTSPTDSAGPDPSGRWRWRDPL